MECQKCILGYSRVMFGLNKETNKTTFFLMVSVNTVGSEDISPREKFPTQYLTTGISQIHIDMIFNTKHKPCFGPAPGVNC